MGHEKETPGHETLLLVSILSMQTARDESCKTITSALADISQEKCCWNSKTFFRTNKTRSVARNVQYESDISFAMEGKEIMFYVMIMKLHLSSRLVSNPSLYLEYRW